MGCHCKGLNQLVIKVTSTNPVVCVEIIDEYKYRDRYFVYLNQGVGVLLVDHIQGNQIRIQCELQMDFYPSHLISFNEKHRRQSVEMRDRGKVDAV